MTQDRVWIGTVSSTTLGRPGLRHKYPDRPWEEPYENHVVPLKDGEQMSILKRYNSGQHVNPDELIEASAIYDAKCFARQRHLTGGAMAYLVDTELAGLLSQFDTGPYGLLPHTIYEEDLKTPILETWWLLGLGVQKDTFCGARSRNVDLIFDGGSERENVYFPSLPDDWDYWCSAAALEGADLWCERRLLNAFFFSNALGQSLKDNGYGELLGLRSIGILG